MKWTRIIVLLFVLLFLTCKQKPENKEPKPDPPKQEVRSEKQNTPLLLKLQTFVNPTFSDSMAIHDFFLFKEINENGGLQEVDVNRALDLYRRMTKNKKNDSWPIFEVEATDNVMLPVEGVGFGGAIWAKVLIDRKTLEIKKIEFEHKAESEGYGDAMTQSAFEDKFVGTKIDLEKNTFTLKKNIEKRSDDGVVIDGISGATMTSKSAVEMVNYGLRNYRKYFEQY